MRIAVLASGRGEKALYIYNFFKEGNRVEVDCLISDRETSEASERMRGAGVETFTFPAAEWEGTGDRIVDFLKSRGIELIVIDGLESPLPPKITEEYGEAIITPSGVHEAPGEVVTLYNKLKYSHTGKAESKNPSEPPTLEEEWAEVLKVDYDKEEAESRATPPALDTPVTEEINQGPVEPVENSVEPVAPARDWNRGAEWNQMPEREPMPETYLVWSVIVTILCCMVPGIVAIIFSSNVSSRYYAGDIEGAKRASKRAQIWIIVSVVTGIIWATLYLPLMLLTN